MYYLILLVEIRYNFEAINATLHKHYQYEQDVEYNFYQI